MKPVTRRPKAVEDVESNAMYIAVGSIDAALRFLEEPSKRLKVWLCFPKAVHHSGMRTKLVKDFPNHVVFYVERENSIEVVRVLRGGQDMDVEATKI